MMDKKSDISLGAVWLRGNALASINIVTLCWAQLVLGMTAYPGYTLQTKTLFPGWPIMAHDMHTRRRSARMGDHFRTGKPPWHRTIR